MKPAISILMPSLNVGPYIEQCLDSVVGQTFGDFEVICIDAGSTDGTREVLRRFEEEDPRVQVILSDRKSYGYQMNLGLDAARGTYVGVVETDDWVEPHMFATLLELAQKHDGDLVKSNFFFYYSNREPHDRYFESLRNCAYDLPFCPSADLEFMRCSPAIWSCLFRRQALVDGGVRFNETPGASYQDTSFFFQACMAAQRAVITKEAFVHYRQDNEASSINSASKAYCICEELHFFEDYLHRRGLDTSARMGSVMMLKFDKYRWNYRRVAPEYQWEFLWAAHEEFVAHREAGLLDASYFPEEWWKTLTQLLDDPLGLFDATCKRYATRPTEVDGSPAPEGVGLVATYALLRNVEELLAEDDAAGAIDAMTQFAVAWEATDRSARQVFIKHLTSAEQVRLEQCLAYVRTRPLVRAKRKLGRIARKLHR